VRIISASFFWRNDRPDGLGLTFRPPGFTPEEITSMFSGDTVRDYFRDSDSMLGTAIVETYLAQLEGLAAEAKKAPLSLQQALLACLNIMYLADRGFIPNDEFNGPMFVMEK
jgi:hypothetical protein